MAGHGDAACPGRLELSAVGNGEPFKVSEQGREQSSGPYFRKTLPLFQKDTPLVFQEEDSRQEKGYRNSGGHCCAVSLSSLSPFEKSHVGAETWASGLGIPPALRPLVCLIGKLHLGASLDIGGLSELH